MKSKKLFVIAPAIMVMSALVGCNGGGSKEYTVKFDTDGGSAISDVKVKEGEKVARPTTDPTKTGYTFTDWYTTKEGSDKFDFDTLIKSDTVIYAHYTEKKDPTLESITAETGSFFYNETIKKSDIKVTGHYSDESTKDITEFIVEGMTDDEYTFKEADVNTDKTFTVTAGGKTYDLKVNTGVRFDVETVEKESKNYYRIINQNENSKGKIYVPSKMKIDNVECEFNSVGKTGSSPIENVFKDNTEITEIHFTSFKGSGSEIASGSFQGCTNLTVCDLGGYNSGLGSIGSNAFRDTAIKEIIMPVACLDIGDEAYSGCSDLKTVSLGTASTSTDSLYFTTDDIEGLLENAETVYTPEGTYTDIINTPNSYLDANFEGDEQAGAEVKWTRS